MVLSVVIPVYNVENYIDFCLESVTRQAYQYPDDVEVVIVNDGSQDSSIQIAELYKEKFSFVNIVSQSNQGLSMARNNGLKAASGDYVWFVDSDDWLLPKAIDTILGVVKENTDIDVIASPLEEHHESTGIVKKECEMPFGIVTGKEYHKRAYPQGATQRFVFRRNFLLRNKLMFLPGMLHEDGLFGHKMLYLADKVMVLADPIYGYRIGRSGSIMNTVKIKSAYDLVKGHKILMDFMRTEVAEVDRSYYRKRIHQMLYSSLLFCKKLVFEPEFKDFYSKEGEYIRKESRILLRDPKTMFRGIWMGYFPFGYLRLRELIRRMVRH